jgi:hypothetical protein
MLKSLFLLLLLTNAALFAFGRGYLDHFFPAAHEPARLQSQFNTDKLKLLPPKDAQETKPEPAAATVQSAPEQSAPEQSPQELLAQEQPATAPAPQAAAPVVAACLEIGNFSPDNATRFKAAIEAAGLNERLTQRELDGPVSHVVNIPAQGSKEATDKKLSELRALGITAFYVMQKAGPLRGSISLGVFKSEEAARAHLAELARRGVRSARLSQRVSDVQLVAFQLRGIDAAAHARLDSLRSGFPNLEERDCRAP